ncbi:hypothetical protein K2Z83_18550 [Oscillochloris sp. ZM17-4]|uniref:hypothetical protein n=1 Tax=Oscillochloris sp. ZM17-4 TaxID=2866714 RepID=UPI001C735B54|nr:hypothetical protein [Oscillochloris sp. ZM17-4]MBX0329674.1 hypothetical protein [Oscillochloris sp. ZM17-4]
MVNLLGWLLCGLLIGWAADRLSRHPPRSTLAVYVISGVMGAVLGGTAALTFAAGPLNVLCPLSVLAAAVGALLAVGLARLLIQQLP